MSFTPFARKKKKHASLRSREFFLSCKVKCFFKTFFSGFLFQKKNKRGLSSRHPHAAIWPFWIEFLLVKYTYKKYQNRNHNNKTSSVHTQTRFKKEKEKKKSHNYCCSSFFSAATLTADCWGLETPSSTCPILWSTSSVISCLSSSTCSPISGMELSITCGDDKTQQEVTR